MTAPSDAAPGVAPPDAPGPQLRRSPRQKVVAGVCGGLGRYCDVDPVIFRIVLGVLSATGGIGLIFYGFAWLLLPLEGEEENEARRLLSGRVDGASLVALLLALIGCGLFLSMLGNRGMLAFAALLSVAVVGCSVWTQSRRASAPEDPAAPPGTPAAPAHPHTGGLGTPPPEVKAPPTPGGPSWWRDPIVKDGTTGPVGSGYLWGPPDTDLEAAQAKVRAGRPSPDAPFRPPAPAPAAPGPRSIGGLVFLTALVAGGLGTGLSWEQQPLGTALQIGLVAALAVFGLGLLVSSALGRTGFGTVLMAMVTAVLLAGATMLPKEISTDWARQEWRPAEVAAVQQRYELGSGDARLDLSGVVVPPGETVRTRLEVGAGRAAVVVPAGVTVKVRAEAGLGEIRLEEGQRVQVRINSDQTSRRTLPPPKGSKPAGTIELEVEVGVGQVEVSRAAS
ncbi:PspC domain-containing protein [Streptomyces sp. ISL-111]|uniref:PspC domain-containing protein n=1 Tax=unclassified Streptomyces TaxID=2593676 RepID=UPI001BE4F822|nr:MULTISPECIES: PspC domain-containing protein [unclassified Streptomyces]MBT2376553.1 PspC domain-containing protein [Streptomyces sp. ISL-111]MBT2424558.1 PspC domain-containing protein [Streptomyces sp. ISL-112]MBT2465093.1 PspC domain-containing protein [Streptomyces sp. ISL-63]